MNLLAAEVVEAKAGQVTVRTTAGAVMPAAVKANGAKVGDKVTLGVRPEHLSPEGSGGALTATTTFVETLGHATYAYLDGGDGEMLTAQLDGAARPAQGQSLTLKAPAEKVQLFDAEGRAFERA
jgi:ABC-type sugar transport system ATPase subunit